MTISQKSSSIIARLTSAFMPSQERQLALRQFAERYGWHPSDVVHDYPGTESLANGHLLVEHGMDNTAVITFLIRDNPFKALDLDEQLQILSISYNNLVDWHLFPDASGLTIVYNRLRPPSPEWISIQEHTDIWHSDAFDRVTLDRPTPNIKSLDDVLVDTISRWRRLLAAEIGRKAKTENIAAFINAIIFVRALEDHDRRRNPTANSLLLDIWKSEKPKGTSVQKFFRKCLARFGGGKSPHFLEEEKLRIFDNLRYETGLELFSDFYKNELVPYRYDFSLISMHALSRIYEHYVSLLRHSDSPQLSFWPDVPEEEKNRALGGIYTPQYIARFFARFLRENLTPPTFRGLRVVDPACGSGIFLRTILEMQCDPFQEINVRKTAADAFGKILGIDVDANACQATELSLSLLHLILTEKLPRPMKIKNAEAIEYFLENQKSLRSKFDAVIGNPPFIKWDRIPEQWKGKVKAFMKDYGSGKIDMFLAHLRLGLEMLKPGGFLLYVLPHSFMISNSASKLRMEISTRYWIRFLADLSEIPVFEAVGSYVILLIVQKKTSHISETPNAVIVRCREFIGHALQDAIEAKTVSSDFYDIYELHQDHFKAEKWQLLPPAQSKLALRLRRFNQLDRFLHIREGFVTGADDIFIRHRLEIPPEEKAIYRPYLSDREMQRYSVPIETKKVVFYPYCDDKKIKLEDLKSVFPKTHTYLKGNASKLKGRRSVERGPNPWWCPIRPRPPERMMRPKIISPHLILLPRFSIDLEGRFAVSRGPILYPKEEGNEMELLLYFLAILNSSVSHWQITNLSHKYRAGYAMLEPKTLKIMSVPDPANVPSATMRRIQSLVKKCMVPKGESKAEVELDGLVADIYGLTSTERSELGIGE